MTAMKVLHLLVVFLTTYLDCSLMQPYVSRQIFYQLEGQAESTLFGRSDCPGVYLTLTQVRG